MPALIAQPTRITAAGNKPKQIDEYIGRVNSGDEALSIAHMHSPQGWVEPGQTPEFDEYTIVLRGLLRVASREGVLEVRAGQAVVVRRGEWCSTVRPGPMERNTWPSVCRRSLRRRSIAIRTMPPDPDHFLKVIS